MKVSDINLKAYENISRLNNRNYQIAPLKSPSNFGSRISGATFADYLTRREINFLNRNFEVIRKGNADMGNEQGNDHLGRRVDVLA